MLTTSNPLSLGSESAGRRPGEWWDRSIFLSDEDAPAGPCPAAIDVTGRARILFYGPYRLLAPGVWRATVELRFCADAGRRPFTLEFGAHPDYTSVEIPCAAPGDHKIEIAHAMRTEGPAEIRLLLRKAAFHGEVRLLGAFVEPVADLPAATSAASTREA
jgi:hypothetical protein